MPMIPDRRFRPERMTAMEAIEWLKTHDYVWYQAPMDFTPTKVWVTSKLKLWKRSPERFEVSLESGSWAGLRFRIDNGHLDRLLMPFELWHHGITAMLHHERYVGVPRPVMVLSQSNGFHHHVGSLKQAIAFARHSAMELTVVAWFHGKKRVRVLVPVRVPINGERTF